jgi:uncharacterized membrane protein
MAHRGTALPRGASAHWVRAASPAQRVIVVVAVGATAGTMAAVAGSWWLGPLVAWDVSAAALLVWTRVLIWGLSASQAASLATRESPGRANSDLLLLVGSVVSLVAVGLVLVRANQETGLDKGLLVGLSVASIILAWSTVHTVYALRYARLYYGGTDGGVDFNDESAPCYSDFAYLALTIGMTFQVSDTALTTNAFRRLALRHALLSYMFGALIIATTINLIAGLGH